MAAVTVRIQGRVQGVGYRYWVARQARLIGIDGWVRNRRDGSVEAVFAGTDNALQKMLVACHKGPTMAQVTRFQETPYDGPVEAGFHMRETG